MIQAKICGLCRPEDAALAAAAGANYLGVILAPGFQRSQTLAGAERILEAGSGVCRVGVMIEPSVGEARAARDALGLGILQLHGDEPVELVRELSAFVPIWKAVRVQTMNDVRTAIAKHGEFVRGLLLDGFDPVRGGGSGRRFDWADFGAVRAELPRDLTLIVAGGLTPENVGAAIVRLNPDVVDVSSGVEAAPCEKSTERVHAFVRAARSSVVGLEVDE